MKTTVRHHSPFASQPSKRNMAAIGGYESRDFARGGLYYKIANNYKNVEAGNSNLLGKLSNLINLSSML